VLCHSHLRSELARKTRTAALRPAQTAAAALEYLARHPSPPLARQTRRQSRGLGENSLFVEFSLLCLSRACLGKLIVPILKVVKQTGPLPAPAAAPPPNATLAHCVKACSKLTIISALLRKTPFFFEFSICLSRACLGNMIIFSTNGPKEAFLTCQQQRRRQRTSLSRALHEVDRQCCCHQRPPTAARSNLQKMSLFKLFLCLS
jgi:hypothetical protein